MSSKVIKFQDHCSTTKTADIDDSVREQMLEMASLITTDIREFLSDNGFVVDESMIEDFNVIGVLIQGALLKSIGMEDHIGVELLELLIGNEDEPA